MALALVIFLAILLLLQAGLFIQLKNISLDIVTLQADINLVRRTFVPPNVGGRLVPTPADIAAARARAPVSVGPNQVDASGVAQVGGPRTGAS